MFSSITVMIPILVLALYCFLTAYEYCNCYVYVYSLSTEKFDFFTGAVLGQYFNRVPYFNTGPVQRHESVPAE